MKISLINMPFAPLGSPSLGLAQLQAVTKQAFPDAVDIQTCYLNLDFAAALKETFIYREACAPYARLSGLADWVFRSAAFPDSKNNADAYLERFYFDQSPASSAVRDFAINGRSDTYALMDNLIDRYELAAADVVGFSLGCFQTNASIAMARRLKARQPSITIVFGGSACRGIMGQTLLAHLPCVDYVFSGPALVNFPAFVSCLLKEDHNAMERIEGLFARGVNPGRDPEAVCGRLLDINTHIPIEFDTFIDKFRKTIDDPTLFPYLLLQTSRGCWWADRQRCTFCGLNGPNEPFQAMAPENAIKHIRSVLTYSDRVSHFVACDNVAPPEYFERVFPALKAPTGVHIKYETRATLTPNQMRTLYNAGIRCIQPGVEALSTESLKLMRKGATAFSNITFLINCIRCHLVAEWNLLLFSPGEREAVYEKYERDLPMFHHLQPPVGVFPVECVRGSRYVEDPDTFGLTLQPRESLAYVFPFDGPTLHNLSYSFVDGNADTVRMDFWMERLSRRVTEWQARWDVAPEERPRLVLWNHDGDPTIYDSRGTDPASYKLSDVQAALLRLLVTPMTLEDAARQSGHDVVAVTAAMAFLAEHHLLFEESGTFLSLIVEDMM